MFVMRITSTWTMVPSVTKWPETQKNILHDRAFSSASDFSTTSLVFPCGRAGHVYNAPYQGSHDLGLARLNYIFYQIVVMSIS